MSDLKSIVSLFRSLCSRPLDSNRQFRAERRQCEALRLHMLRQSEPTPRQPVQVCTAGCGLKDMGFTPYADVLLWKRRFYAALAILVLLVTLCLWRGKGAGL